METFSPRANFHRENFHDFSNPKPLIRSHSLSDKFEHDPQNSST